MIETEHINEWKKQILNNPKRLQEEQEVIDRYGELFHPSNLDDLTKEQFNSFLLMKNNRHWNGIFRQKNMITSDMDKLREALKILLDESKPIEERLDTLFPKNAPNYIKGLGRAIVTPILLVVYPDKYGVFNTKSKEGLTRMNMLPNLKRKSFAERYVAVNKVLNDIADRFGLTLWQTDEIVGWIATGNDPISTEGELTQDKVYRSNGDVIEDQADFGLESHLEDFIVENWDRIEFSKNYDILVEDGELIGQQYMMEIGRIDLLCKSKDDKEWLVLELKKGRSGDAVTGQILRYISWVKANLAQDGETVRGVIILGESDDKLIWSVKELPNVQVMTYSVSFELNEQS